MYTRVVFIFYRLSIKLYTTYYVWYVSGRREVAKERRIILSVVIFLKRSKLSLRTTKYRHIIVKIKKPCIVKRSKIARQFKDGNCVFSHLSNVLIFIRHSNLFKVINSFFFQFLVNLIGSREYPIHNMEIPTMPYIVPITLFITWRISTIFRN